MKILTIKRWLVTNTTLLVALGFAGLGASALGSHLIAPFSQLSPEDQDIFWISRLPRVLLAGLSGMALGASGTAFQGLLQNSLADPYILGVSSGAALGSILGLALNLPFEMIPLLAFASALAAMMIVYTTASFRGQFSPHTLLLTGVILNAFLFAFILLLNSFASFEESQRILLLLIGNLESESYRKIFIALGFVLLGIGLLTREGHALNLISAGSETASSLGVNVNRRRRFIFFAASLMVGAVVPLTGLIGFIGLFVPHITRSLLGSDHRLTIPASAWIGGILLIACDTLARTALVSTTYQTELPVGAVTAFFGAPFFLLLLKRGKK